MAPHPHYSESPDAKLIAPAEWIIADQAARQAIPNDPDRDIDAATSRLGDLVEKLTAMKPRTLRDFARKLVRPRPLPN